MKKYDYLIVGAGLYGAVMAYELGKKGKKCLVIDRRDHIAGNIYCEDIEGIHVHKYGAHIFHTSDKRIWDYVNQFAEFNNYINSPVAVYKDELYNLPFNMNTFSKMWGIRTPQEAAEIIERQRKETGITEPKNLEEQALFLVGKDIYEKLVKGYTEKQWGRKCTELPAFIIKRLPCRFIYDNNYFSDRYQGIPEGGYTPLIEALTDGADILFSTDYLADRPRWDSLADMVLYTGCLDALFGYSEGRLQYRSEIFEEERLETEDFQGNAVVNYTDRETPWTRIIEHKHFDSAVSPVTWISREYPVDYEKTGEPFYPIGDERNKAIYAEYRAKAMKENGLVIGGRLADYAYYDMDKTVEAALAKARSVL